MMRPLLIVTFVTATALPYRVYCNDLSHAKRVINYPLGLALISTFDYLAKMWIVIGSKKPNQKLLWIPEALDIVEAGVKEI